MEFNFPSKWSVLARNFVGITSTKWIIIQQKAIIYFDHMVLSVNYDWRTMTALGKRWKRTGRTSSGNSREEPPGSSEDCSTNSTLWSWSLKMIQMKETFCVCGLDYAARSSSNPHGIKTVYNFRTQKSASISVPTIPGMFIFSDWGEVCFGRTDDEYLEKCSGNHNSAQSIC